MIIIGITGTLGAGKGTIVEYLTDKKDFIHYSVRGYLIEEIKNRGLKVNRDSMVVVANDLRANHSPSFLVEELYKLAEKSGKNCIIESIRTPGEIEVLTQKENFHLLAVDAMPEIRYDRIKIRNSETDDISFNTFVENEKREMNSSDSNKQNLSKCIEAADFRLNNDERIEILHGQIEEILRKINIKKKNGR